MNVLAVGCHPDDVEEFCSGTLLKCKKRGDDVTVCHITNGNMGHEVIPPDELRTIRINEARRAGSMAGLKVITTDIGDLRVDSGNRMQLEAIVKVIEDAAPDFIITHSPNDYMSDHIETSKLVVNASYIAVRKRTINSSLSKYIPVFFMDNACGIGFEPTEYVDISDEFEFKLKMLECHESQIKWLRDHDNIDYLQTVRRFAGFRGDQCGVCYAEAFRCSEMSMITKRLLP